MLPRGILDGYLDGIPDQLSPWDYLGALLICEEAGVPVVDVHDRPLVDPDPLARRQLIAAGTGELLDGLRGALSL